MQEITVTIKWDNPDEPHWLNPDNIRTALSAYCPNTTFGVEASRDSCQSEDTKRLDALQDLTEGYGDGWILRQSSRGRGMRLHEEYHPLAVKDVRCAIDQALARWKKNERQGV